MAIADHLGPTKLGGVMFVVVQKNWYFPLFTLDASKAAISVELTA